MNKLVVFIVMWAGMLVYPVANTQPRFPIGHGIDREERLHLRERVRDMFYHGYNSYLDHAFPMDELRPLSCKGSDRL